MSILNSIKDGVMGSFGGESPIKSIAGNLTTGLKDSVKEGLTEASRTATRSMLSSEKGRADRKYLDAAHPNLGASGKASAAQSAAGNKTGEASTLKAQHAHEKEMARMELFQESTESLFENLTDAAAGPVLRWIANGARPEELPEILLEPGSWVDSRYGPNMGYQGSVDSSTIMSSAQERIANADRAVDRDRQIVTELDTLVRLQMDQMGDIAGEVRRSLNTLYSDFSWEEKLSLGLALFGFAPWGQILRRFRGQKQEAAQKVYKTLNQKYVPPKPAGNTSYGYQKSGSLSASPSPGASPRSGVGYNLRKPPYNYNDPGRRSLKSFFKDKSGSVPRSPGGSAHIGKDGKVRKGPPPPDPDRHKGPPDRDWYHPTGPKPKRKPKRKRDGNPGSHRPFR